MLVLLLVTALSADCPWASADDLAVSTTLSTVTVNGSTWDVRGDEAREQFRQILEACDSGRASRWFRHWRLRRRAVNGTAAGVLSAVATPFAAVAADDARRMMLVHLRASQPPSP